MLGLSGAGLGLALGLGGSIATPYSLPGAANLKAWWQPERGGTLAAQLRPSVGATSPLPTISGNLNQTIGFKFLVTGSGGLGAGSYAAYYDGGGTPFQTGTITASVYLAELDITVTCPPGPYVALESFIGVGASWAEPITGAVLLGAATDSAKPTIAWNAQNSLPMWHCGAGTTGMMYDEVSSLANTMASGINKPFSIFGIYKPDSAAPSGIVDIFGFKSSVDADPLWVLAHKNVSNLHRVAKVDNAGNATSPIDGGAITTNARAVGIVNYGATFDFYLDSITPIITGAACSLAGTATFDTYNIGGRRSVGNALEAGFGDQLHYNLAHPDPVAIMSYLKSRWAI